MGQSKIPFSETIEHPSDPKHDKEEVLHTYLQVLLGHPSCVPLGIFSAAPAAGMGVLGGRAVEGSWETGFVPNGCLGFCVADFQENFWHT